MLKQPHPIQSESKVPLQKIEKNEENATWKERKFAVSTVQNQQLTTVYQTSWKKNTFDECPAYDMNVMRYDHTTCRQEKMIYRWQQDFLRCVTN